MKKERDPFPITDVYFLEMNAVDAATVTVGDLCERLTNDFDTGLGHPTTKEFIDRFKNIDATKYNSISYGNSADGGYSVYVGVDAKNKIRKIFAEATMSEYHQHPKDTQIYKSYHEDREDLNDQFFNKINENRIKLFDLNSNSGLLAVGDYAGPLRSLLGFNDEGSDTDADTNLEECIDLKYFKKDGIFQNTTPILIVKFVYGLIAKAQSSSFSSSVIHKESEPDEEPINYSYTELFSNLLDENCYPTKYIFENYLVEKDEDNLDNFYSKFNLTIKKDIVLSAKYISSRLPKAIQILEKQSKILFKENFKKAFEIRKKQFENFIIGIIKDIEPQELNLPTFKKKNKQKKLSKIKLEVSLSEGVEKLFDGYKLKEDIGFSISNIIFPVKKGSYPVYLHCFPNKDYEEEEWANVTITVEGINGCYLNKSKNGKLITNRVNKESPYLRNIIDKKLKYAQIDKIDLRDTKTLIEIEKLKDVEHLVLTNMKYKDWTHLSKLKNLKHLHLNGCIIEWEAATSFFKALYKLPNLEKFSTDITTWLREPDRFPKDIYPKKLKDFEVIVPKYLKDEKPADKYIDHKGYAANDHEKVYMGRILQVHNLPNFEKIKSFVKLRYYNYFSVDHKEGNAINNLCSEYLNLSGLKNMNKLKDVWIYGYNFKKSDELKNTKFLKVAKKILEYNKVKINGISEKTFQNL